MELTHFGRAVRKARIDRGLLMKTMADHLGVSPSYVSAVESGRRPIPEGWPVRIAQLLGADMVLQHELNRAAELSAVAVSLPLKVGTSMAHREFALQLARRFEDVSDETLRRMQELLARESA